MKKLTAVGLIFILLFALFNIQSIQDVKTEEDVNITQGPEGLDTHPGISDTGERIASKNENGGYWSDTFEDNGKVDSSENIRISDGKAAMAENEIPADDHTMGLWRFDEGNGRIAQDSSGNGNDGTIIGANWTESETGTALEFDGLNDHIDCGNNGTLNITDEITIEAWMKPETSKWDNWSYKKTITVDHTGVHGTLSDFPLLVSTVDPDLRDTAHDGPVQPDGGDLLFTTENGTKLDHEIESYHGATGELTAWVRLPVITDDTDTELHLYYGNSASTGEENPEDVWDGNYRMVQHLGETDGEHLDSTSNDNDGTEYNQVYQDADGKINGADQFDGANDYVGVSDDISLDIHGKKITIEAWIRPYNIDSHSYVISRGNDLYAMLMSWRTVEFYYMKNGHKWESVETVLHT